VARTVGRHQHRSPVPFHQSTWEGGSGAIVWYRRGPDREKARATCRAGRFKICGTLSPRRACHRRSHRRRVRAIHHEPDGTSGACRWSGGTSGTGRYSGTTAPGSLGCRGLPLSLLAPAAAATLQREAIWKSSLLEGPFLKPGGTPSTVRKGGQASPWESRRCLGSKWLRGTLGARKLRRTYKMPASQGGRRGFESRSRSMFSIR
jgi:hypothetical protein